MKPRSKTLFHFTKTEKNLFDILKNGFWPQYCWEDVKWQGFGKLDFIAFPMVCFCDIPLSRISDHVESYGSYGIGLNRAWAKQNNVNPLMYVSADSNLSICISQIMEDASHLAKYDSTLINKIRYLIAHIKPTFGRVNNQPGEKEFYQESEWRYVPIHENIKTHLMQNVFRMKEQLEKENKKTKKYVSLKFKPKDVAYVFVTKDTDIPNIIDFMQSELTDVKKEDLKVLYSRVISLESIARDF